MSKQIKFNNDARVALQKGIDKVANAVGVTLGAKGRNVIIQNDYGNPHVTKDGVSVARSITLPDPVENMGAKLIIEAASKTVNEAGDGTSTTCVLAQALVKHGLKEIADIPDINPMDMKKGIDLGVSLCVEELEKLSIKIDSEEQIKNIATISSNNDEHIGRIIAQAFSKATKDGAIRVEESKGNETYVELVEGTQFINGLISPYFITNHKKLTAEYENPLFLFYDGKISGLKEFENLLNIIATQGKSLVIFANDFDGSVIEALTNNIKKYKTNIMAVRSPSYKEKRDNYVNDLCLLTGATLISDQTGDTIDKFNDSMFGTAEKIVVGIERTTIIKGGGNITKVKDHVENLTQQAKEAKHESDEKDFRDRIAKLTGGVGVIYVGANTEVEMNEKKDRIEDALLATKAATEEGIVAGGGQALQKCGDIIRRELGFQKNKGMFSGMSVLLYALNDPFNKMVTNAGLDIDKIILENGELEYPMGLNFKTEKYVDLVKEGVVDPKKVTRVALETAASIASMILTTEVTVSKLEDI